MDYWIHIANVLYLLSYLVKDILWLRCLTVVAGLLLLPYQWMRTPPLIEAIVWNSGFMLINVVQIYRLLLERRPVKLTDLEQRLYHLAFRTLTPREFTNLLKIGCWKKTTGSQCLVEQGKVLDRIMVLFSGKVNVRVGDKPIATLERGRFVGEMSFLAGGTTSASVWAEEPVEYIEWPSGPLKVFLKEHPTLRSAFQLLLGTDLVAKLKSPPRPDQS